MWKGGVFLVEWLSVAILAPMCLIGGIVGTEVADRLLPGVFRAVVTVFGAGAGVAMLFT